MEDLSGRTAFVTGAASGIGRALAERFAREGMSVVLADVEAGALARAVAGIEAGGGRALGAVCDVSKRDSLEAAAGRAFAAFGNVHVVCNNAGVSPMGPVAGATAGDWEWSIGVNLMGVVHGIQVFVPHMQGHAEGGHIVNTASIAGLMPIPFCGVYTATKFAVVGLSEVLRVELEPQGIGVSVLCPSFVDTRLHECHRNQPDGLDVTPGVPDFVAQALAGGASPETIAEHVVRGIRENRLHLLTHPDSRPPIEARMRHVSEAFDA